MSFFSKIISHEPVMRLLRGNDHTDHSDGHGGNIRLGYPMIPGETVSSVAVRLHIPIDELLSSNPTLKVDTPLTPGLDINLPTRNLDQTLSNIANLSAHDMPAHDVPLPPQGSHELLVAPALPANAGSATIPSANDIGNIDVRNPAAVVVAANVGTANPGAMHAGGIDAGLVSSAYQLAGNAQATPAQNVVPDRSNVYMLSSVMLAGASKLQTGAANDETMPVLSFSQAASTTIRAVQSQNNGELPPPPPMPPASDTRNIPLVNPSTLQTPWAPQAAPSAWHTVIEATDGNQAKLQIMALMAAAQMEGAVGNGSAVGQTPGFIDPQALAAYATNARAGRSIDLGSGRTLQFSLVSDPLRRVGAIGEEQRAATAGSRRTGDGLDQVPQDERTEPDEETQDGHQERNHERRRLATIAAMRRRRRPLSTRCRCRVGDRRPLHAAGFGRYPKGVDVAEFRGRLPQRYLWTASPKRENPDGRDPQGG
jgi:hypothetical protein